MTLKILLITILIAVRVNHISCYGLTIDTCLNDKEVVNTLKKFVNGIVPLLIIENENANPLNEKTTLDTVKKFFESQNIIHLIVVPGDKCVVINDFINSDTSIQYPSLFMVTYGRLLSKKITDISLPGITELYEFAIENHRTFTISDLTLESLLLTKIENSQRNVSTNPNRFTVPTSLSLRRENSARNQQNASIIQGNMAYQTLPRRNIHPDSLIVKQPIVLRPIQAKNTASPSYMNSMRTTSVPQRTPLGLNLTQSLNSQNQTGESHPIRRGKELQTTRDLLSDVERQGKYRNDGSGIFFTPMQSSGLENYTLDDSRRRPRSTSPRGSSSGPSTRYRR